MKKIVFAGILFFISFLFYSFGFSEEENLPRLIIFHSPSCHRCVQVKSELMPSIEKDFEGKLKIDYHNIDEIENYKLFLSLKDRYNGKIEYNLPLFFCDGRFLDGRDDLHNKLRGFVVSCLNFKKLNTDSGEINLVERFKHFSLLAVSGAGLVDGVNPCAFTVIIFFISFLALQGYRRKDLILVGMIFILAVFVTYILIGLGVFGVLYKLEGFWSLAKAFNIAIGIFSLVLGALALYDFIKFRKTKKTEGLILQLPQAVKNRIHYVIGLYYRKTKDQDSKEALDKKIFALVISALVTGFLVSLLELICTGQTYLPTITFILKTTSLKVQALGYLLLYNFMFIVPLLIVFILALLGVTSEQFSSFLKKNLGFIKILMAAIFIGLGILLIWRP